MTKISFNYEEAFSRNIGWLTEWEQQILRNKKIAVSGMGGVGGVHLLTLTRLGVQNFSIADLDNFELANFNRQLGAFVSTIGQPKTDILTKIATDINPNVKITSFNDGITEESIDAFLEGADLYVDGLDFYILEIRRKVFKRCSELNIPAITAAPIGMGTAYLIFMPGEMTFEKYFDFTNDAEANQLKFLMGLSPTASHRTYLVDPSRVDMKGKKAPSTIMGCTAAAGVTGTEAVKILLKRGKVLSAPWYQSFDPYLNKYNRGYLTNGNRNIFQMIRLQAVKIFLLKSLKQAFAPVPRTEEFKNDLDRILDYAKWTPSGDNSQPWSFEVKNETEMIFHLNNEDSIYDYDGIPSITTIGFFIETFRIAAAQFGYRTDWVYQQLAKKKHVAHIRLTKDPTVKPDSLLPFIKLRTTNRYPYTLKKLTTPEKIALETSVGTEFKIRWFEKFSERLKITQISAYGTFIRLSLKEAFSTHQHIVDFENRSFSIDRIPIRAVGVSPMMQKMMEFQLRSLGRANSMNRFMGAAILAQFEINYLPFLFCAANYLIEWKNPKNSYTSEDYIRAGQAVQRFWLTATQLGISMQPNIAPLALAYYAKNDIAFTQSTFMRKKTHRLAEKLEKIASVKNLIFMGRVGILNSKLIKARSIRRELPELKKPLT